VREFVLIWQALPKVVFSRTLDSVEGANTTLASDDLRAELTSFQESVRRDVAVGGAELAAEAARLDLSTSTGCSSLRSRSAAASRSSREITVSTWNWSRRARSVRASCT
jgi:hypothetical protein